MALKFSGFTEAEASDPVQRSAPKTEGPAQRALRLLRATSYPSLRRIACEEHEGMLVLRGSVPWFYLKQVAQALASQVVGGDQVVNRIEVSGGQAKDLSQAASPVLRRSR